MAIIQSNVYCSNNKNIARSDESNFSSLLDDFQAVQYVTMVYENENFRELILSKAISLII